MAMRQINKDDWSPRLLLSRAGRPYTPSSYREERELLAEGYTVAPAAPPEPDPAPDPAPEPEPAADAEPETPADADEAEKPAADAPKTKTTRRTTGGAQ